MVANLLLLRCLMSLLSRKINSIDGVLALDSELTIYLGNLMLAIQARSFNSYFYLQSNNTNHPSRFIGNKVTGILFENKVDYTCKFQPHCMIVLAFFLSATIQSQRD